MSAAKFEDMSNDQLRQQMEDFGLPKVPITASTRNILIKRLQNHVNGGAATTTGKSTPSKTARRETIHVAKFSSDDDSDRDAAKEKLKKKLENHKNARRQTLGGGALSPAPIAVVAPAAAVEKPSRKSVRATPTKTTGRESGIMPPSRSTIKTATIPVTIEDSDEDVEEMLVVQEKSKKKTSLPTAIDRRSKSKTPPKLGKSDLVTTSYKQYVSAAAVREEEPIELEDDDEEDDDEHNSDLEEDVPLATRYSSRPVIEPPRPASKYSPVKPMSIRISPLRRTTLAGGTGYRYEPSSAEPVSSSTYQRPSLAPTSYTSSYSSKYGTNSSTSSSVAGSGRGDVAGTGGEEDEFPYLREFSKRLSTLKAEPLYKRTNVPLTTSSTSRTTTTYERSVSGRSSNYRPVIQRETHWYDPITQFLGRAEEKYALKQKILILLAILIFIFVLVMIWN